MKTIKLISLSFIFLLNSIIPATAQSLRPPAASEVPQISTQDIINNFYQNKAKSVFQDTKTYRARYNAVAFYSYPRTFWEDTLPLPPYNKKGALFTQTLQDTYASIKNSPAPNPQSAASTVVNQIISNPRRVEVAKSIPFPQVGDVWHNAFYISSFYIQLGDFASKIKDEAKVYNQYQNYLANNDSFMLEGYQNYDFTLAKAQYNPNIFYKRMVEIEAFAKAYSAQSNGFIRRVLAPMQVNIIPGADVKKHLAQSLRVEDLPPGVSVQTVMAALMYAIPAADVFYQQAAQINPSIMAQLKATGTVFNNTLNATWDDVGKMLSMFEYVSPGSLLERLGQYGKIPTRQEALDEIASTLAAAALNKNIAQISNDLFEFEKPFYYSDFSMGAAQSDIVKNWYEIATNSFYTDKMVAKIATDNILQSGKRAYQDSGLSSSIKTRRIKDNTEFYKTAIPIATDFVAGDIAFILVSPIFRVGRFVNNTKRVALTSQLKNLRVNDALYRTAGYVSKPLVKAKADIAALVRIKSVDGLERAVWEIKNTSGHTTGYFKLGSKDELARTKLIDNLIKEKGLTQKYNLLDIEYAKLISEGLDDIPLHLRNGIDGELSKFKSAMRDAKTRDISVPFTTQKVDTEGFTIGRLQMRSSQDALGLLNNTPITQKEWNQVVDFYATLNGEGFYHTDIWNNLHIRRLQDGKLKITLLDFENIGTSDMRELSSLEDLMRTLKLREKKGNTVYPKAFISMPGK